MSSSTTKSLKTKTVQFAQKNFNIGFISPLTNKRNVEIFFRSVEPLCELGFNISVLAVGDEESQESCFSFAKKYPKNFRVLESIPQNHEEILEKSQIMVFTSDPSLETLKKVVKKGVIPVLPLDTKYKNFENFDPQQEVGNSFLYDPNNFWEFLATIIRAYENFKFSYDWNQLKKSLKETEGSL